MSLNVTFILDGDLNAKHSSWNNFHLNHNDKILDEHALEKIYFIRPFSQPTLGKANLLITKLLPARQIHS